MQRSVQQIYEKEKMWSGAILNRISRKVNVTYSQLNSNLQPPPALMLFHRWSLYCSCLLLYRWVFERLHHTLKRRKYVDEKIYIFKPPTYPYTVNNCSSWNFYLIPETAAHINALSFFLFLLSISAPLSMSKLTISSNPTEYENKQK